MNGKVKTILGYNKKNIIWLPPLLAGTMTDDQISEIFLPLSKFSQRNYSDPFIKISQFSNITSYGNMNLTDQDTHLPV